MTDETEKVALFRIFAYSPDDDKLYAYMFTEEKLQEAATTFHRDIFFMMTDEEIRSYEEDDEAVMKQLEAEEGQEDNLKHDFIMYHASVSGASYWECTCKNFLETDTKGEDRMLKRTLAHARKTGHALHPRGN